MAKKWIQFFRFICLRLVKNYYFIYYVTIKITTFPVLMSLRGLTYNFLNHHLPGSKTDTTSHSLEEMWGQERRVRKRLFICHSTRAYYGNRTKQRLIQPAASRKAESFNFIVRSFLEGMCISFINSWSFSAAKPVAIDFNSKKLSFLVKLSLQLVSMCDGVQNIFFVELNHSVLKSWRPNYQ